MSTLPMEIAILGVPLDLGAARRGVDMGPSAIRLAGLQGSLRDLGHRVTDLGNLVTPEVETRAVGDSRVRFAEEIAAVCDALADRVAETVAGGCFPLVLGGDHSIAMGSVGGVARSRKQVGLLWIDAHSDFNTPETSPSGNVHGMPLAAIVGRGSARLVQIGGVHPKCEERTVAIVGARSVDRDEKRALARSGVRTFTMREIDERGLKLVMEEAIRIACEGTDALHVSLDMDALDPKEAPGTGNPVSGGLTYREAHLAMEMVCDSGRLSSMDVVETNPILDEQNRTALLAVELVCSALGSRIVD